MQKKAKAEVGVWYMRRCVDHTDGDILAALMLSQIAYWYSPSKTGPTKLRVIKKGHYWLAKSAKHWHEELGLSQKQSYRAQAALRELGLIETLTMKFDGSPMVHIRLTDDGFSKLNIPKHKFQLPSQPKPFSPVAKSLTVITSESTTEPTACVGMGESQAGGENKVQASYKFKSDDCKHTPEQIQAVLAMFYVKP